MKGRELYEHIRSLSPTARFLFVSGYRADMLGQDVDMDESVAFLEKPFDLDELSATIRKVLV
jgi:two-component system cell cycle sensor histidine kinase/response regulator CckA